MEIEEVSHSQIYHKLGTLEGLLLGVQKTLVEHSTQSERLDVRVGALERRDSSGDGIARTGAWIVAVVVAPITLALLGWGLTRLNPPTEVKVVVPGESVDAYTLPQKR